MNKITFFALWILIFTIPWEDMVVIPGFGTFSRLVGILCFIFAILSVLISKRNIRGNLFFTLFNVFLLWSLATILWSFDKNLSLITVKTLIQILIFIFILWEFTKTETDLILLMQAFVLGSWISGGFTISSYLNQSQAVYLRYAAPGFDPNELGLILSLGIPIAWYLFLRSKGVLRVINLLYIPMAIFSIVLTGSRASSISLAIALCFIVLTFQKFSVPRKILTIAVGSVVLISIYSFVPQASLDRISTIGNEITYGDFSSRLHIWGTGLEIFSANPIFGVGAGAFQTATNYFSGEYLSSHNLFIDIFVGQGVIGGGVFLLMLIYIINRIIIMPNNLRLFYSFELFALLVGVMSLNWAGRKPVWLIFSFILIHSELYKKVYDFNKGFSSDEVSLNER